MNEWGRGPANFRLETTTLWSFPERGRWATHDGGYRGNWSPYLPRNLILRFTRPGDLVVDPFVGGGTTAIEAKLLGRTLSVFERAGFVPREIVIKAQHHTRMAAAWQQRAAQRHFLLLAHEYLFILTRPG